MKSTVWLILLGAGFTTGFIACNNSSKENNTKEKQQTTLALTPLPNNEIYTCTMHNEVMSDHSAVCPKCGMPLLKQKMTPDQEKLLKEGTFIKPKE